MKAKMSYCPKCEKAVRVIIEDLISANELKQFDEEVELPDDFPDLNGMSADEMKQTVIDWINADPDNRKSQIMAMLPELSSIIM